MTEQDNNQPDWQYVVFVIDGRVEHKIGTDETFAAILASDPIIKDITDLPNRDNIARGATYNAETDSFVPFKAYDSWVWNEVSMNWVPPVDPPVATETTGWAWSEEDVNWVAVPVDAANAVFTNYVE